MSNAWDILTREASNALLRECGHEPKGKAMDEAEQQFEKTYDLATYLNGKAIQPNGRVMLDVSFEELKTLRAAVAALRASGHGAKLGSSEPLGPHYDGTTMDNQKLHAGPGSSMTTAHPSGHGAGREALRKLVDIVWNEATESTAVPSTKWADRLIDRAFSPVPLERTAYPSTDAMKAAVELEIHAALGYVDTVTIGRMIQKAIDAALPAAPSPDQPEKEG